jgi:hypothetical protein
MGRHRLRYRRIPVRSLSDAFLTINPDGTSRHRRLCHSSLSSQPIRSILRHLPHRNGLFPLHRRKHHLVVCKLRAGWQTCRVFGYPAHSDQYWRCGIRSDLPEQCGAQVYFGSCVEFGLFGFCVVRMVDYQGDLQEEGEEEGWQACSRVQYACWKAVYGSRTGF